MQTVQATTTATQSSCPECGAAVPVDAGSLAGEILPCADCGAELELVSLEPLELALAPEVEEDWGE